MRQELIPWMIEKLAAGETPKYYPYGSFVRELEEGKRTTRVSPFKCGACRGTTTVGADGTLYPCHRFVGMQAWRVGNVADGPDYERCKQFWRDYRASLSGVCQACALWTQCQGPCPWEIARGDGSFTFSPRICDHVKAHIERAAYVYWRKQTLPRVVNEMGGEGAIQDSCQGRGTRSRKGNHSETRR
jgi:radical SAM protein with 4Fe4S-binding SPASM domain